MTRHGNFLLAFAMLFITIFVGVAHASKPVEMVGLGSAKCSEFINEWEKKEKVAIPSYFAWSQGFMTSFNIARNQKNLPTKSFSDKNFDMEKQIAYLVSFCKMNPSKDYAAATINLYKELPNKKKHGESPMGMVRIPKPKGEFYMDKTEVTQEAYQRVIGSNPSNFKGCPTCPVEQVSWFEADAYCKKVGKRLPTEQEWEFAATSGGKGETWAGTSNEGELGDYAWYYKNSNERTHPVGEKKPNGLGLYDMSGNVYEWIDSWYDDSKTFRVLRGGSWFYVANNLRTAYRDYVAPDGRGYGLGFRCSQ